MTGEVQPTPRRRHFGNAPRPDEARSSTSIAGARVGIGLASHHGLPMMQTGPRTFQKRAVIHEDNGTRSDGWVRVRKNGQPSEQYLVHVLRDGETGMAPTPAPQRGDR